MATEMKIVNDNFIASEDAQYTLETETTMIITAGKVGILRPGAIAYVSSPASAVIMADGAVAVRKDARVAIESLVDRGVTMNEYPAVPEQPSTAFGASKHDTQKLRNGIY